MTELRLKVNRAFDPLFNDENRYLVLKGGGGSGKSVFAAQKILLRIISEPGHRFLICRKVGNTIQNSCFKLLNDIISEYGLTNRFTVNKSTLGFKFNENGGEIITTGLDDVEKLKSIAGVTGIWIEEATELTEGDFTQLDLRLRGDTASYKQIILSFNPIDETHWLKRRFWDNQPDNSTLHHSTYLDNHFIDAEYIKMLREQLAHDENLERIYLRGEWGRIVTGAEFYTAFKFMQHVKESKYNPEFPVHVSFDFNVVPYISATLAHIVKRDQKYVLQVFDEFALKNPLNTTESLCRAIIGRYGNMQRLFVYGDATGRHRDTRGRENDYDIIGRMMAKYMTNNSDRVPVSNPALIKRREFINSIFRGALPIEIEIDPRCKELIADLESVVEDVDGTKLKKRIKDKASGQSYEEHGHMSDCLDYKCVTAFQTYYDNYRPIK